MQAFTNTTHPHNKEQPKAPRMYEFTKSDYTLRITGRDKSQILNILKDKCFEEKYIVGFEEGHCHIVMHPWTTAIKQIRTDVKSKFNILKASNYSLSKIRDNPIKALAYILKDGDYHAGCNTSKEQLEIARKLCFGKGRKSFQKSHEELLSKLAKDNKRKQYFYDYVALKVHHNQNIYWHHIKAHCTTVFMKMDINYRNDLLSKMWADSGLMSKEESDEYYQNY